MNMDINMNASHPTSDTYIPNMMPFDATNRPQHLYPDYVQHPHYPTNTNYYYPYINPAPANPYHDGVVPMSGYPMYVPEMVKVEDGGELAAAAQIGLNLGHRTYFSSGDSLAIDRLFRRSRGFYQVTQQAPRCQAEGCKADLSGAKHYHRRHKVCEYHSKATVVVAAGLHQRFCQQCSRFHVLSEFDEAKRSCRKRLADHNRRRRKPQPGTTPTSATTDPSPQTNNSTTSSTDETKRTAQNTTSQHICTSSSTDCLNKDHNSNANSKTTFLRNGPALSLGGAEDGRFGLQNTTPLYQNRSFGVMSDEESSHYPQNHHHHHMSPSSSSATFFQPRRGFFCSNSNDASRAASGNGSTAQVNHQSSMLNHGHGLFEVDFM